MRLAISVAVFGATMTRAIYLFNELYDNGGVDGFTLSSLEVLEKVYGKRLSRMKRDTLISKVIELQSAITDNWS